MAMAIKMLTFSTTKKKKKKTNTCGHCSANVVFRDAKLIGRMESKTLPNGMQLRKKPMKPLSFGINLVRQAPAAAVAVMVLLKQVRSSKESKSIWGT